MITLPRVAYRIEEEKETAAVYDVELAYPWLDFQLLRCFLGLKENQLIYKRRGRFFYKTAVKKYIKSAWYFNYSKMDSVIAPEPLNITEKELNVKLVTQYNKLPLFFKQYNFDKKLLQQHRIVKEILLFRMTKITTWLR